MRTHIHGPMSPGRTSGGKMDPSNEILKQVFWPIETNIKSFTCKKKMVS